MKIRRELPEGVIEINCSASEFNSIGEKLFSLRMTEEKKEENYLINSLNDENDKIESKNDDHNAKREALLNSNLSRKAKNLAIWMYDHYILPKHLNKAVENLNTALIRAENTIKSEEVRKKIFELAEVLKINHPGGFYVGMYHSNSQVINAFTNAVIDKIFKNVEKFTNIIEVRLDDVVYCIMDSLAEIHNKNVM